MLKRVVVAGLGVAALAAPASAALLMASGNFCSVANIADPPAGIVPAQTWNDLTAANTANPEYPTGYGAGGAVTGGANPWNLKLEGGAPAPADFRVEWDVAQAGSQNTNDRVVRPMGGTLGNHIDDGHDQLMAGYVQASRFSKQTPAISLSAQNLSSVFGNSAYSVYWYFDGDGDVQSPNPDLSVSFELWATEEDYLNALPPLLAFYGSDEGDFAIDHTVPGSLADYHKVNAISPAFATPGNFVGFEALSLDSFFILATGVAGEIDGTLNGGGIGVALNGFQIAIVPEPTGLSLLALPAMLLLRRRRR